MSFQIDDQTKKDLDIFGTYKSGKSVFDLFDLTTCKGGQDKLYKFLSEPMTDLEKIKERKDAVLFFRNHVTSRLNIDKDSLDYAVYYLKDRNSSIRRASKVWSAERSIMNKLNPSQSYHVVENGVNSLINILKSLFAFSSNLSKEVEDSNFPLLLKKDNDKVLEIFTIAEFQNALETKSLKPYDIDVYDSIFRYSQNRNIQFLINLIYEYDALQAIANAADKYNLSYPEVLPRSANCLDAEGLFHPFVENAVANDVSFGGDSNLLFITGPNMAGKSTFLKALGVSAYLAHAGFPVPAKSMKISLISGLCTTINISDDLHSGYSHFYAEVLRVKYVAAQLKENNNLLVIFDELFRGTNVKDAYDGTLAIVSAFARIKSSFFVISTHIIEAAESLSANENISFRSFEIREVDGHPTYTYKLKNGISTDRLGMYIIRKERVVEMINEVITTSPEDINIENNK